MDKTTEELIKAFKLASQGDESIWLPITTLTVVFGVVISLLLYIWNNSQKINNKRHEDSEERHSNNEKIFSKWTETQATVTNVLTELRANQKHQQKEIDKLIA